MKGKTQLCSLMLALGLAASLSHAASISISNQSGGGGDMGFTRGTLTNPDVVDNPRVIIGSNSSDNDRWGFGNTSAAVGPDIGSSFRGSVTVRASSIIAADYSGNLGDLDGLNNNINEVELTLTANQVGAATSSDYAPRVHFYGIHNETRSDAGYWPAWRAVAQGVDNDNTVAGTWNDADASGTPTAGDSWTFTFSSGISGCTHSNDFIGFAVVGNEDAVANEQIYFNAGTLLFRTDGQVISVNLCLAGGNDNNAVDIGESAVALSVGSDLDGGAWNNVVLLNSGIGSPDVLKAATQGGNSLALTDNDGATAAVLTSSGAFSSNYSETTDVANRDVVGEAGLMHSKLHLRETESLTISNISSTVRATSYKVVCFVELGQAQDRDMALRIVEGPGGRDIDVKRWTRQTDDTDSDADEDGYMEWVEMTGTSLPTATPGGNYIEVRGLTADSFTIYGSYGGSKRGVINGFQIIKIPPEGTIFKFR